jgi:molybdate transport system substrate-binding protein
LEPPGGIHMTRIFGLLISLAIALAAVPAGAADLKVTSAGAVRGLIAGMIEDYRQQTGKTFDFTTGTTGQLRAIIQAGFPADLVITSAALMTELEKTGNLTPGSRGDLGRVGIGVVVREGAALPDVSTVEAFKKAMIEAKSVAYTDPNAGGTSGIYMVSVLERLGIADIVKKKAVLQAGGKETAEAAARGDAEIGVTFISEILAVKGAKLVAPLPADIQDYTLYTTAIPKASTDPDGARAFVAHLTSPAMAVRWKAAGFEAPK